MYMCVCMYVCMYEYMYLYILLLFDKVYLSVNPFAYTYGWELVWATDVFAFS
jgi:hypothetical protein